MTVVSHAFDWRVTIDGIVTPVISARTDFGFHQPASTCSLLMTSPLPAHVTSNKVVVVEIQRNGVWYDKPRFTGYIVPLDPSITPTGETVTVNCQGNNGYRMSLALEVDKAFTGGAKSEPVALFSGTRHIGNDTISWYENNAPDGLTLEFTVTPLANANHLWLAGWLHGTNSYPESIGDSKITKWSRAEIWKDDDKIGYGNFGVNSERYNDEDPTHFELPANLANWQAFTLYIGTEEIMLEGEEYTVKIISGTKPGSGLRDEYELTDVTYQTSGQSTLREIGRGLKTFCGFLPAEFDIADVKDLDGGQIRLGGNGYVEHGQVVLDKRDIPSTFYNRLLELFGYADFDCPDGKTRTRLKRGTPSGAPAATFTEGTNLRDIRGGKVDPQSVYNAVIVDGARGSKQSGTQFAYSYQTDDEDILPSEHIPNPPGVRTWTGSNSALVSDALCEKAGKIAEVIYAEPIEVTWTTWPHDNLYPGRVVQVTAPSNETDDLFFLDRISDTISASGLTTTYTGWRGTGAPFEEQEDPDPDEDTIEPEDRRPLTEWGAYRRKAGMV